MNKLFVFIVLCDDVLSVHEGDKGVVEGVTTVERTDHRCAAHAQLSGEVDGAQRARQAQFAHSSPIDGADERVGEGVHEVDMGGVGLDAEVDEVALGGTTGKSAS